MKKISARKLHARRVVVQFEIHEPEPADVWHINWPFMLKLSMVRDWRVKLGFLKDSKLSENLLGDFNDAAFSVIAHDMVAEVALESESLLHLVIILPAVRYGVQDAEQPCVHSPCSFIFSGRHGRLS